MSEHDGLEAEIVARGRAAYVAAKLRPELAAWDAARPAGWRERLPPPHWARPWSELGSPTLMALAERGVEWCPE